MDSSLTRQFVGHFIATCPLCVRGHADSTGNNLCAKCTTAESIVPNVWSETQSLVFDGPAADAIATTKQRQTDRISMWRPIQLTHQHGISTKSAQQCPLRIDRRRHFKAVQWNRGKVGWIPMVTIIKWSVDDSTQLIA